MSSSKEPRKKQGNNKKEEDNIDLAIRITALKGKERIRDRCSTTNTQGSRD
jgi:hypothetical protein